MGYRCRLINVQSNQVEPIDPNQDVGISIFDAIGRPFTHTDRLRGKRIMNMI